MVFEYGMSEGVVSRTMRADNYSLSEETKRLRDSEQARLTDGAYEEAIRLLEEAPVAARPASPARCSRRRRSTGTTLATLLSDVAAESRSSDTVGTVRGAAHSLRRSRGRSSSSIGAVEALRIHHLGVAVADLDEAVGTYERLFGGSVEHGGRSMTRASRQCPCESVRAGSS